LKRALIVYDRSDEGFLPQKEMELRTQGVKSAIDGIVQEGTSRSSIVISAIDV